MRDNYIIIRCGPHRTERGNTINNGANTINNGANTINNEANTINIIDWYEYYKRTA